MLSSYYEGSETVAVQRRGSVVDKPLVVSEYSKYMEGVYK